jgi:DNA-binding Xre family transcriptional regulator
MVSEQARLRELAVEQVRVTKAKEVEDIGRQKETQLKDIERQEELEVRKKKIADVVRDRIAVEKTVATEEEAIKDLRAVAAAKREKEAKIIGAEAQAQEVLVKEIKKAEADEEVAKYRARQRLVLADAELEAADRDARAKMRLSEGQQAEHAAEGLAEVRVKEADAAAVEKQGLAKVRVRDAEVALREREGAVEAENIKKKELAEATGIQQKGLASVQIKEADSVAVEKLGKAEASAVREKLLAEVAAKQAEAEAIQARMLAEAEGLRQKAEAMKQLDVASREHEEFRLRLGMQKDIALQELETRKDIAENQAEILSKAFERANINIVGGDGAFFDRFVRAVGVGSSIDGAVGNSKTLQALLHEHLGDGGQLGEEVKNLLGAMGAARAAGDKAKPT